MGCGVSKVDDLPLVALCRERKELLRAAADHRYALAAAHVAYFDSLRRIGEALHRFVNEELSPSPVLTLPPSSQSKNKSTSSSSASLSHSLSHESPASDDGSHLHLHSDSGSVDGHGNSSRDPSPRASSASPPPETNYYYNYMRSTTAIPTMVYQQPDNPYQYPNPNADPYPTYGGYFGSDQIGYASGNPYFGRQQSPAAQASPPPPPPPPEVSSWDFLNPFESFESLYPGYGYPDRRYRSSTSSPDSAQVREQEGIPDLEDETAEQEERVKGVKKDKQKQKEFFQGELGEGTSKAIPKEKEDLDVKKGSQSNPSGSGSKSNADEENVKKKGVSFGGETADSIESARPSNLTAMSGHFTADDSIESARPSNITNVSTNRTRDIREVVKEIKEQFETASGYGKEVAGLLEAGKLHYRPRNPIFEVFSCRFLDAIDPRELTSWPSSKQLHHTAAYALAKSRDSVPDMKSGSLSSTLEQLYAWEKKLYKEVKVLVLILG